MGFVSQTRQGQESFYINNIGFVNNSLAFVELRARSPVNFKQTTKAKQPYYDWWQAFTERKREEAPAGLKSLKQTAGITWAVMPSETNFSESAIQGILLAIVFSFVMLVVSTRNIYQSLLSLLCVALIIASILCIMVLKGWSLGIAESICVVIAVGLSVDYVIHLSTVYQHSQHKTRGEKMQQSFAEMDGSILNGTLTTAGAGVFLFFGIYVPIFGKFGTIIISTVCVSFLVSMCLYGAISHTIGPENGAGDLSCSRCKSNSKTLPSSEEK